MSERREIKIVAAGDDAAMRTCARCGREFACGADTDSCWCEEVTLTEGQRATLAASGLTDCLCRSCLEGLEEPEGPEEPE